MPKVLIFIKLLENDIEILENDRTFQKMATKRKKTKLKQCELLIKTIYKDGVKTLTTDLMCLGQVSLLSLLKVIRRLRRRIVTVTLFI